MVPQLMAAQKNRVFENLAAEKKFKSGQHEWVYTTTTLVRKYSVPVVLSQDL